MWVLKHSKFSFDKILLKIHPFLKLSKFIIQIIEFIKKKYLNYPLKLHYHKRLCIQTYYKYWHYIP